MGLDRKTNMELEDLASHLPEDPEAEKHRNTLLAELSLLEDRLKGSTGVSDGEILDGLWNRFDLVCSTDCFTDTPWLVRNLSFTSLPISETDIPRAWRNFQARTGRELCRTDYPVLEALAYWYFDQREIESFGLNHMVAHAAAIYEYLIQELWGWQNDPEFSEVFKDSALNAFYLSYGLRLAERSKFLAQVLELEFQSGRLSLEDFEPVREMVQTINKIEKDKEEETNRVLKLHWDTINDRDRKIQQLESRLETLTSQHEYKMPVQQAGTELSAQFGNLWGRLEPQTRRYLALSHTFSQEPLSIVHPDVPAWALYRAINSELTHRLFKPRGLLDKTILDHLKVHSPISLLIEFQRNLSWEPGIRAAISEALEHMGGQRHILADKNVRQLRSLRDHRNWSEHPVSRSRQYSQSDLVLFKSSLVKSAWVTGFLRLISSS